MAVAKSFKVDRIELRTAGAQEVLVLVASNEAESAQVVLSAASLTTRPL